MDRSSIIIFALIGTLLSGGVTASETGQHDAFGSAFERRCRPILPLLAQQVPADIEGNGIRSCDVINSPLAWASFCADNGLACEFYDEEFFQNWAIVAVVIETISPVICENAGPTPGWEVSCLTQRRQSIRARVSVTLAGSECWCSMGPQFPSLLYLVNAVATDQAATCRAWQETHTFECLRP